VVKVRVVLSIKDVVVIVGCSDVSLLFDFTAVAESCCSFSLLKRREHADMDAARMNKTIKAENTLFIPILLLILFVYLKWDSFTQVASH